jgi:hypothetical protein
MEEKLQ